MLVIDIAHEKEVGTLLELKNVSKTFNRGNVDERIALKNVSLHLEEGDFVTVIGGNGAGKSTMLNCISGITPVDSGQIILNEKDITYFLDYRRSKDIARLFQDPMMGTAGKLTVEENLSLALKRGKKRSLRPGINKYRRAYFEEQLALLQLGLEERLTAPVNLLSGGQRQALTLLMTNLVEPKLVLLDEHTASLDPKTAKKVLELTRELVEKDGITTLMVTHNMEQALQMGNRTIMMHEGEVILDIHGDHRKSYDTFDLVEMFHKVSGEKLQNDRLLLSKKVEG